VEPTGPARFRRRSRSRTAAATAAAVACGALALTAADVPTTRAGFGDAVPVDLSLGSAVVTLRPGTPASIPFDTSLVPGEAQQYVVTVENDSTVEQPFACVVVDVLPQRAGVFSPVLASLIGVVVERKPGAEAEPGTWTTVRSDSLLNLTPETAPAFGGGIESAGLPVVDNGEAVTYRFSFLLPAGTGGTVDVDGVPTDLTVTSAAMTFGVVAENVTGGGCDGAVSA
jgi:hypothetical protein